MKRKRKQNEHRMKSGGKIPGEVQRNREGRMGVGIDGETLGVMVLLVVGGVVFSFKLGF